MFILYSVVFALGYDGSLLTGLQALPEWKRDFGSPKGYTLGMISASYFLYVVVAALQRASQSERLTPPPFALRPKIVTPFVVAAIADKWGRKITLHIGAFLMIAGALVGTFSYSRGQLIGSRIILGVGTVTAREFVLSSLQ